MAAGGDYLQLLTFLHISRMTFSRSTLQFHSPPQRFQTVIPVHFRDRECCELRGRDKKYSCDLNNLLHFCFSVNSSQVMISSDPGGELMIFSDGGVPL